MRIKLTASFIFCFLSLHSAAAAFNMEGVENLGMGGVGLSVDSPRATLYNPALLGTREKFSLTIFELPITISHDLAMAGMFIYQNMDNFAEFEELTKAERDEIIGLTDYNLKIKMGAINPSFSSGRYPLYTGARWWDMWWGLGLYNEILFSPKLNEGILIPNFDLTVRADAMLNLPLVFRTSYLPWGLPGEVHTAVAPKYLMRVKVEEKGRSIVEAEEFIEEMGNKDFTPAMAPGFDFGLYYRWSDRWTFAAAYKNISGITLEYPDGKKDEIPARLDTGFSFRPGRRIELTAEVHDIKLSDITSHTFFTKLHLGCELSLTRSLKLRGGLYQGYPTGGLGIGNFFNYAFYGRELGGYAGANPFWSHAIIFAIRI